jgi:hypothetical protein
MTWNKKAALALVLAVAIPALLGMIGYIRLVTMPIVQLQQQEREAIAKTEAAADAYKEQEGLREFMGCLDAQYRGMRITSDEGCIARAERK